ncbi:MAG TPA: MarR family transcriptional regulator [Pseudonocardiaceae bacterium]|nr:MarR family transcriptional regulator [Pseudonocardiaceae bacterium]
MAPSSRPARIGFLLAQLGAHAGARFADRTKEIGLTPAQAGVLRVLGRQPGMSQRDLAGRLGAVQSRVVVLIDGLEAAGLVVRERSTTDRRNYALQLTDAGRAALGRLRVIAEAHEADIAAGLTAEQRDTLAELLTEMCVGAGLDVDVHAGIAESERKEQRGPAVG